MVAHLPRAAFFQILLPLQLLLGLRGEVAELEADAAIGHGRVVGGEIGGFDLLQPLENRTLRPGHRVTVKGDRLY